MGKADENTRRAVSGRALLSPWSSADGRLNRAERSQKEVDLNWTDSIDGRGDDDGHW